MKMTSFKDLDDKVSFATAAKDHFRHNPKSITFSKHGQPEPGEFYAVRFGLDNDCVVIFKIDEYEEILNFQNCIPRETNQ